MSLDYTALAETAVKLITDFGRDLNFTSVVEGAYSPATGAKSTVETPYTKKVAVTNYSSSEFNDIILQGDLKLVSESYAYAQDDKVTIDAKSYRIININRIKPAATEVAVILQVRK